MVNAITLKLFIIFQSYLSEKFSNNVFSYCIILLFTSLAVIDGPNIVQELTGEDAGLQSSASRILAIYNAGRGRVRGKGTQKLSTLCHELGHALRHNTVSKLSTHGKELEADAVSVMIESGLGLELTDARKDHLADHYRDFKAEIKQELGKDFTDEAMIQKIDDMLSSVYSTYNDIVEDLNKSIEKYVPQERLLEYQKNNEVSHEQLPKKDIDVAPEMDMDYDLEM